MGRAIPKSASLATRLEFTKQFRQATSLKLNAKHIRYYHDEMFQIRVLELCKNRAANSFCNIGKAIK